MLLLENFTKLRGLNLGPCAIVLHKFCMHLHAVPEWYAANFLAAGSLVAGAESILLVQGCQRQVPDCAQMCSLPALQSLQSLPAAWDVQTTSPSGSTPAGQPDAQAQP